jgi:hypothetical protein
LPRCDFPRFGAIEGQPRVSFRPVNFTLSPHNLLLLVESYRQKIGAWGTVWGVSGMYLLAVFRAITSALMNRRYRPELHYMRGPGPKWFERHGR